MAIRYYISFALVFLVFAASCRQEEVGVNQPQSGSKTSQQSKVQPGEVTLACSFEAKPGAALHFQGKLANFSSRDIYVLNRLWTLDSSSKVIPDSEKFYRFVRGADLRILWGAAPLPRLQSVTYRNVPHATLLKTGGVLQFEESMALPATEYSPYFPPALEANVVPVQLSRVVLVIQYVEAGQGVNALPLLEDPSSVRFESAAALDHVLSLQCASSSLNIEAQKRTDQFDRLTLPGEMPEPLAIRP
ncbi:MAG: hypothetical protein ACRD51_10440 [Candidatus Acidiferrum sp.]